MIPNHTRFPVVARALVCTTAKSHLAVKMENRETEVQIEPGDFARFEGEGGREAPIPELVDIPLTCGGSQGLRVRKQVYELTLHDLRTFPVWEFGLDEEGEEGRDESTVRPYTASGPFDSADCMFVVRAVFTPADGSRMQGYFTPPGRGDASLGTLQPIIVTGRGQVRFGVARRHPARSVWPTATSCSEKTRSMYFRCSSNQRWSWSAVWSGAACQVSWCWRIFRPGERGQ